MSKKAVKDLVGQKRYTTFPMQRLKLAEPDSDGHRRFEGYASVFGNRDSQGDVVVKGAFEESLQTRPDVKVLWQHKTDQPIGLMEQGYENEYGLRFRAKLSNTDFVKGEVVPLLEDGVVNGLSIGYQVKDAEDSSEGYLLKKLDLFEVSAVTFPANELANVTSVKSLDSRTDIHQEQLERYCKSIMHELDNYFTEDNIRRLDGVNLEVLRKAQASLRGRLADLGHTAADAQEIDNATVQLAFLAGVDTGLSVIKELKNA